MINLAGPVQGDPKKEKDMFVFRVADTSVAITARKTSLMKLSSKIKSGVWVTVRAESQITSSGDHIYDAKEIKINEGFEIKR